jgi:hypothetical protein
LSVLRQYLSAVKARGLCPSFIRTDKGTETIMLADAYFSLFTEAALAEHWPDEEYDSLRIDDVPPQPPIDSVKRKGKGLKPPTPSPTFEPFTDLDDVPPQAPIDSVKRKGKGLHKRTISAAYP